MPLTIPSIDDRRYQDLLDEALARIPVYTPEWTNFNKSDPGVTLLEVFAFLTESLLYRANQIPDRNRRKFLQLLGIGLQPASAAQGLVTIGNDKGPLEAVALNQSLEVFAGAIPFRTTRGLDVLPLEARFYVKKAVLSATPELLAYYQQLYSSFRTTPSAIQPQLYQATPFPTRTGDPIALSDTVDGAIWLALLVRAGDQPLETQIDVARGALAGQTLSLGVVPSLSNASVTLPVGQAFTSPGTVTLLAEIPSIDASGGLLDSQNRVPQYRALDASATNDVFSEPGTIDITLPSQSEMVLWNNIDPLEAGVGQLPPTLEDDSLNQRVITWLRIRPSASTDAQFLWMGVNCVPVTQRAHVSQEVLPDGTGEPDQAVRVTQTPILPQSVRVFITANNVTTEWTEIDDLSAAGPEVPVPDPRLPPGSAPTVAAPSTVFAVDPESGIIRFGDGARGARPAEGAAIRADYDYSVGAAGNLGAGAIKLSPALPAGLAVSNPITTWGGADAETVLDGEKQISRYLQHRDRLVNIDDFKTITMRTPGVSIGRVDVIPNYNPSLAGNQPGDAAGAVTLMIIPDFDASQPDAPQPDRLFLDTICAYLDVRRLITTEVFLRGPVYIGIWISMGIRVLPGRNDAPICQAVKDAIRAFLSPLTGGQQTLSDDPNAPQGWPLTKSVIDLELATVAGRVPGVDFVQPPILIAEGAGAAVTQVDFTGLQLPRILGISVTSGAPLDLDQFRGLGGTGSSGSQAQTVQIPAIPQECG